MAEQKPVTAIAISVETSATEIEMVMSVLEAAIDSIDRDCNTKTAEGKLLKDNGEHTENLICVAQKLLSRTLQDLENSFNALYDIGRGGAA